jgi:polar amino acid transport system substrate-binding protein
MLFLITALSCAIPPSQAQADTLLERALAGETIKIGFSNEPPYVYPDKDGSAIGFTNTVGIEILRRMGIHNIEYVRKINMA